MKVTKTNRIVIISLITIVIVFFSVKVTTESFVKSETSTPNKITDTLYTHGEDLFVKECSSCHALNMKSRMTAPPLGGITKKRNQKWLYQFTRNATKMYEEKDPIAVKIKPENGNLYMTAFPKLTDYDLKAIYYFIERRYQLTLKGVPIKKYFKFNEFDNNKAIACIHVLDTTKNIAKSWRPNNKDWYFSCSQKHRPKDWKKTSIRKLCGIDSSITELYLLRFKGEYPEYKNYVYLTTAKRKSKQDEWNLE